MVDKHQAFVTYSNKRQFPSLMGVFIKSTWPCGASRPHRPVSIRSACQLAHSGRASGLLMRTGAKDWDIFFSMQSAWGDLRLTSSSFPHIRSCASHCVKFPALQCCILACVQRMLQLLYFSSFKIFFLVKNSKSLTYLQGLFFPSES